MAASDVSPSAGSKVDNFSLRKRGDPDDRQRRHELNHRTVIVVHKLLKAKLLLSVIKEHPVASVRTKAWEKALARASIEDFAWHGLWHTWASWHVQAGTPLAVLKEFGGWASYVANMRVHGTKMAQSPLKTVPQSA